MAPGAPCFPAFWGALLFAALVVGPTIWLLDRSRPARLLHARGGGPLSYLKANWLLSIGFGIHDIFVETTHAGVRSMRVLNGSIWTLIYEWTCCLLMIAVAVLLGVRRRAKVVVGIPLLLLRGRS